jgi:hypothetical protein
VTWGRGARQWSSEEAKQRLAVVGVVLFLLGVMVMYCRLGYDGRCFPFRPRKKDGFVWEM